MDKTQLTKRDLLEKKDLDLTIDGQAFSYTNFPITTENLPLGENEFVVDGEIYLVFRNGLLREMLETGFNQAYNIK